MKLFIFILAATLFTLAYSASVKTEEAGDGATHSGFPGLGELSSDQNEDFGGKSRCQCYKTFSSWCMNGQIKLECLYLAGLFSLI
jgi:hypothetical protein